jgi:hypothetical protein
MSRIDDELKIAFRREEPSPDFAARVLQRINQQPAPKPGFWQRLAALFQAPRVRWAMAGATAALIIAISAVSYLRIHQAALEGGGAIQAANPSADAPPADAQTAAQGQSDARVDKPSDALAVNNAEATGLKAIKRPARPKIRTSAVAIKTAQRPSPEAEAAKERVLFALQIAGETFNDAQRAIQENGAQENPEPLHTR